MLDLSRVPKNLPAPVDDRADDHLVPREVALLATAGSSHVILCWLEVVSTLLYAYPLTGRPGHMHLPPDWDLIPGARGCTPFAIIFRSSGTMFLICPRKVTHHALRQYSAEIGALRIWSKKFPSEKFQELRMARDRCQALTADLERSKADNVKLYEKMRYVQDYTQERPVPRGKKRGEDLESGTGVDVESKYKKIYEDDINPFTAFSKKEKERRYRELGIRDKITLTSGRFLLGNKYARTFIFFYSIGLHLLVFASMYRFSSLSHSAIRARETEYKLAAVENIKGYLQANATAGSTL